MTTTVVYADAADGYISSGVVQSSPNYGLARSGNDLAGASAEPYVIVGQYLTQTDYYDQEDPPNYLYTNYNYVVYEAFLGFDTSSIDDGDSVSAAVLNVTSYLDNSTTDFTIQARLKDWGTTVTTADWVAGADLSGLTLLANYATSGGFTADSAYNFSDSAMPANVNKTGVTRMLLCSDRTTGNNAPTGDEYVNIKSADTSGTTSDPKLTVTHAAGAPAGFAHSFAVIVI